MYPYISPSQWVHTAVACLLLVFVAPPSGPSSDASCTVGCEFLTQEHAFFAAVCPTCSPRECPPLHYVYITFCNFVPLVLSTRWSTLRMPPPHYTNTYFGMRLYVLVVHLTMVYCPNTPRPPTTSIFYAALCPRCSPYDGLLSECLPHPPTRPPTPHDLSLSLSLPLQRVRAGCAGVRAAAGPQRLRRWSSHRGDVSRYACGLGSFLPGLRPRKVRREDGLD